MVKSPSALPFVEHWRRAILASNLPAGVKVVAIAMAIHMNRNGESTRAGATRLGNETHLDRANVVRARTVLLERGWLQLIATGGSHRGETRTASEYRGTIPPHTTSGVTTPVVRDHQWRDDINTSVVTTPTTSVVTTPKVVTSGSHQVEGLKVVRTSGSLLTSPRPLLEEELDRKLAELEQTYTVAAVTHAIDQLAGRTFAWPSAAIAAINAAIPKPINGAAPPPWNPPIHSDDDPPPALPTRPPDHLLPRNRHAVEGPPF